MLHCAYCVALAFFGVGLQNIVDSVVRSYGAEVSEPAQEKLFELHTTASLDRHHQSTAPDVWQGLSKRNLGA